MKTYIVGVTGGIGSGKSAVCREFERYGIKVVDADIAAREVVVPGSEGLADVVAEFGQAVLNSDGTLNRGELREIVFQNADQRAKLEAILHPKIRKRIEQQLAESRSPYTLLCVPLMVERGNNYAINRLLVVDCDEETQIERVMQRDNLTRSQVLAIMSTQASREERLAQADDVIMNDGSVEDIADRVKPLHAKYLALSGNTQ